MVLCTGDEFSSEESSARTLTSKGPPPGRRLSLVLCAHRVIQHRELRSVLRLEGEEARWLDGCYAEIQVFRLQVAAVKQNPLVFCCVQLAEASPAEAQNLCVSVTSGDISVMG